MKQVKQKINTTIQLIHIKILGDELDVNTQAKIQGCMRQKPPLNKRISQVTKEGFAVL